MTTRLKAYKATIERLQEAAFFSGQTVGEARYACLLAVQDTYGSIGFKDINILRAAQYDCLLVDLEGNAECIDQLVYQSMSDPPEESK